MWQVDVDVLVTDLGDELVLMQAASSQMFELNASGRLAWQTLPATTEQVRAALIEMFDIDADQAQADAHALLHDLAARNLIHHR